MAEKQITSISVVDTQTKRAYQKHDTAYWTRKTIKAKRRQINKQRTLYNAGILGRASKLASTIYRRLPPERHKRYYYRALVALSMELLKADLCEEDILAELVFYEGSPAKIESESNEFQHTEIGVIKHPQGCHYFVTTPYRRYNELSLPLQIKRQPLWI